MNIDVHNHAIPSSSVELLRREGAYGATVDGDRVTPPAGVPFRLAEALVEPGAKLADLDANRLDAAIVSPAPPILYYGVDPAAGLAMSEATNEGLAAFCAESPDRLRWMATAPMQAPELAAETLERAADRGCVGVEVLTVVGDRRLDEPDFEPLWATAERLALPVMLHPAYNVPHLGLDAYYLRNVVGNLLETTLSIERLICAGVLDRHPGLTFLCVHAGGFFPMQAGRLRHARRVREELASSPADPWAYRGQLVVDTITHDDEVLAFVVSRMGPENVLLGTDLPFEMASPDPVGALERALEPATASLVAEGNARRLYPPR